LTTTQTDGLSARVLRRSGRCPSAATTVSKRLEQATTDHEGSCPARVQPQAPGLARSPVSIEGRSRRRAGLGGIRREPGSPGLAYLVLVRAGTRDDHHSHHRPPPRLVHLYQTAHISRCGAIAVFCHVRIRVATIITAVLQGFVKPGPRRHKLLGAAAERRYISRRWRRGGRGPHRRRGKAYRPGNAEGHRESGVTAPAYRRPPPAGPKAGNRPEAGWYGCEAPQGSPVGSPRCRKARQSRSGASLHALSPV